jgi:hypothetical protein
MFILDWQKKGLTLKKINNRLQGKVLHLLWKTKK